MQKEVYTKKKENENTLLKDNSNENFLCEISKNLGKLSFTGLMREKEKRSNSSSIRVNPTVELKEEEIREFKKRNSSMTNVKAVNKMDKIDTYSTLNSSVSTVSFVSSKAPSLKARICKEFELRKNFAFNWKEYVDDYQDMLMDTEDQISRKGNFELLFPKVENIERLSQYIRDPKDDNIVLWKWIMSGKPSENFKNSKIK